MSAETALANVRPLFPALSDSVYLISHSLGAMPRRTYDNFRQFADEWAQKGINAWDDWTQEMTAAAERIGALIGAPAGSTVMATNVSQVQALVASCFDFAGERRKVVFSELNFPSVSYLWHEERRRGAEVVVVRSDDGIRVATERMVAAIDERTLIVPISHVLFRSSAIKDVAAIVKKAHSVGALVLLDCYQSVGTLPVDVTALDVDFACGGSVKWLCGGPGAAYLYVHPKHISALKPRATGWWGHEQPFTFQMPEQRFANTIWRFMAGTPAVAALYQARAGIEIVAQVGIESIRAHSLALTTRLIERCDEAGYRVNSPRLAKERGGTVCFDFPGADEVTKRLNAGRFYCDHRPNSGIRVSPHFYTQPEEIERFMDEVARLRREV